MKIRAQFVSNSSSASFCLGKTYMTEKQIKEFHMFLKKFNIDNCEGWVHETEYYFFGEISRHDYVNMQNFLENRGVDSKYICIES